MWQAGAVLVSLLTHLAAGIVGAVLFFAWLAWAGITDLLRPWSWRELTLPIAWDVQLTRHWFADSMPECHRSRSGRLVYV